MADGYTGWKLLDKVTIVAKRMLAYDYKTGSTADTGNVQGYLVDPSNKKQLENARQWGTVTTWEYFTDDEGRRSVRDKIEYKPVEYTYDNDGFTLELHNSAGGSSQGGKLSFWNCWITAPDGHRFLIGIAADLLLDVLKSSTVINGVVQDKLMFARCNGGVGMLSKSMDSYKNAVNDMANKKKMSSGKTKKVIPGHIYETTTEQNIYVGKMYQWYEEVRDERQVDYWHRSVKLIGFKRLEKPREFIFYPSYSEGKDKLSDYSAWTWQCRDSAPARRDSGKTIEMDMSMDEVVKMFEEHNIHRHHRDWSKGKGYAMNIATDCVGLSASNDPSYTLPEEVRKVLKDYGLVVYEG